MAGINEFTLPGDRVNSSAIAAKYDIGGKNAVSSSITILVYISFFTGCVGSDDASLGSSDEVQDSAFLLRIRESLFYLCTTVCDIISLEINSVVDILDVSYYVSRKSASAETYDVHACIADRITSAENIRRNILVDLGHTAYHGMASYS